MLRFEALEDRRLLVGDVDIFYTQEATYDPNSVNVPRVVNINFGSGASYVNTTMFGTGGAGDLNGSKFVAVSAVPINALRDGDGNSGISGGSFVAVTVTRGTQIVPVGGQPGEIQATFEEGFFAIHPLDGGFNTSNPTTWDVFDGSSNPTTIALWKLKAPETIRAGDGEQVPDSTTTNTVTQNVTVITDLFIQALVRELDPDNPDDFAMIPVGLQGLPQVSAFDEFINLTTFGPFLSTDLKDEGLFLQLDQRVRSAQMGLAIDAADVTALNAITQLYLGLDFAATVGDGLANAANYDPLIFTAGVVTDGTAGDFASTLGGDANPGGQFQVSGSIHGIKYEDLDGDGEDDDEPRLEGWQIFLDGSFPEDGGAADGLLNWTDDDGDNQWDPGEGEQWIDTDSNGEYWFTELALGTYVVREVLQDGWVQTSPVTADIVFGEDTAAIEYVANEDQRQALIDGGIPAERIVIRSDLAIGNARLGSIHGIKYEDLDGDGVRDENEPLLAGVTFTLTGTDGTGNPITPIDVTTDDDPSTTTVDETGMFWFTDLKPGIYTVTETLPPGYSSSTHTGASGTVSLTGIVVESGVEWVAVEGQAMLPTNSPKVEFIYDENEDEISDLAFGNYVPGSIHGIKYEDLDGDGVRDENEPLLAGVTFTLTGTDGTGNPITPIDVTTDDDPSTTTVDETGMFWFTDLKPGIYTVTETLPPGYSSSTHTGASGTVSLTGIVVESGVEWVAVEGQAMLPTNSPKVEFIYDENEDEISDLAFGNYVPGSIHGIKYHDVNGNGIDDDEPRLEDWQIFLDENGNGVLEPISQQTIASTAVPLTALDTTVFSRLTVAGASGSIQDINVTLDISHTFNGDAEVYLISPSGTRVELFTNVGGTSENFTNTTLDDESAALITSGVAPFTGSFRPEGLLAAFDGENPNGEWTLEFTDIIDLDSGTLNSWSLTVASGEVSTTTDADGNYWFTDLPLGTYTVREVVQTGWVQSAPATPTTVTIQSGQEYVANEEQRDDLIADGITADRITILATLAFGNYVPGSIHGIKYHDLNADGARQASEPLLAGVTFTLTGTDGTGDAITPIEVTTDDDPSTTTVDETGMFWFTDLKPGTYTVTETLPVGQSSTTHAPVNGNPTLANIVVTSGVEWVAVEGQAMLPTNSLKEELIYDENEDEIPDLAFGNAAEEGSIHGFKWNDKNANGVWDHGETGINGWIIYIDENDNGQRDWDDDDGDSQWDPGEGEQWVATMDDPHQASTAANSFDHGHGKPKPKDPHRGAYWFDNLAAGEYIIRELIPPNWRQSYPGSASDPDGHVVTVVGGQTVQGRYGKAEPPSFGNYENKPGSIHGHVFHDFDKDGMWDEDEPALNGFTVYIDDNPTNGQREFESERAYVTMGTLDDSHDNRYTRSTAHGPSTGSSGGGLWGYSWEMGRGSWASKNPKNDHHKKDKGVYWAEPLEAGTYYIRVDAPGYTISSRTAGMIDLGIEIEPGQHYEAPFGATALGNIGIYKVQNGGVQALPAAAALAPAAASAGASPAVSTVVSAVLPNVGVQATPVAAQSTSSIPTALRSSARVSAIDQAFKDLGSHNESSLKHLASAAYDRSDYGAIDKAMANPGAGKRWRSVRRR